MSPQPRDQEWPGWPSRLGLHSPFHSGTCGVPSTHRGPCDAWGPGPKPTQSFLGLKCQFKSLGPANSAQMWFPGLSLLWEGRVQPSARSGLQSGDLGSTLGPYRASYTPGWSTGGALSIPPSMFTHSPSLPSHPVLPRSMQWSLWLEAGVGSHGMQWEHQTVTNRTQDCSPGLWEEAWQQNALAKSSMRQYHGDGDQLPQNLGTGSQPPGGGARLGTKPCFGGRQSWRRGRELMMPFPTLRSPGTSTPQ